MSERSRALGKIIFTNSVHQVIPWAGHANYAAAKGGLKLLMETIAQELAGEKIRVNAIPPVQSKQPSTLLRGKQAQHERSCCSSFRTFASGNRRMWRAQRSG